MKIGDNDIQLAQLIYGIVTIGVLVILLTTVLHRNIKKDFASIELIASRRDAKRAERRRLGSVPTEDEMGLTNNRARSQADPEEVSWKKLQGDVFRAP